MTNVIKIPFDKTKTSIINLLKENRETYFELDDAVKYDYRLLSAIFDDFKYDLPFLDRVLQDVNQNHKEAWTLEFDIRYLRLLEERRTINTKGYLLNDSSDSIDLTISLYKMIISSKVNFFMDELERAVINKGGPHIGMGFMVIEKRFHYSDVMKEYYAQEFIRKIFQNPNIESYLHQNYNDFSDIKKDGIVSFIVEYVRMRDEALSFYIMGHRAVLTEILYVF